MNKKTLLLSCLLTTSVVASGVVVGTKVLGKRDNFGVTAQDGDYVLKLDSTNKPTISFKQAKMNINGENLIYFGVADFDGGHVKFEKGGGLYKFNTKGLKSIKAVFNGSLSLSTGYSSEDEYCYSYTLTSNVATAIKGNTFELDALEATELVSLELSYDCVEATEESHDFSKTWSHDETHHWHECLEENCSARGDLEEHYDWGGDHVCDVCGVDVPWVEKITIDHITGYIGTGEKVLLTANVTAHNGASTDVEWTISSSTYFTLTDNKNGTATLTSKASTTTTERTVTVTATSKFDGFVSKTTDKIYTSTYGSDKRNTLNGYFGSGKWQTIPYFPGVNFTVTGDTLSGAGTSRSIAQMKNSFDNQGTWTKISADSAGAVYQLDVSDSKGDFYYECEIFENPAKAGKASLEITKHTRTLSSFPTEKVSEFVKKGTQSTVIAPDDGTSFSTATSSSYVAVTSNGSGSDYATKLGNNGYYVVAKSGGYYCVSPERTLKLTITNVDGGFKVEFTTVSAPTKTAWSTSQLNSFSNLLGDGVEIPFIPNDYGNFYDYGTNEIYSTSTKVEAPAVAIGVLDAASGFTKTTSGTEVIYTKALDTYYDYSIAVDGTTLYIRKVSKTITTWNPEDVAASLGVDASELANVTGTEFKYTFEDGHVSVVVTGDPSTTVTALTGANYKTWEMPVNMFSTKTCAISLNQEVYIEITTSGSTFTIDFRKQSAPITEDWTEADKSLMNEFMNQVAPFAKANFNDWSYGDDDNSIYTTSSRGEAIEIARLAFAGDNSWTPLTSSNGSHFFEKSLNNYVKLSVTIEKYSTRGAKITIEKAAKELSTWETEEIANHLAETTVTLPDGSSTGTKFFYEFGENKVSIKVTATSEQVVAPNTSAVEIYNSILTGAGFTSTDASSSGGTFVSSDDTLTVTTKKVSKLTYTIDAFGHLPTGFSRNFPMDAVINELAKVITSDDLPTAEGSLFEYEDLGDYQCTVRVAEGGNMANYASALLGKGFSLDSDVYSLGTVCVTLTAGTGDEYTIKFYLSEAPVSSWPDFSPYLSALGFEGTVPEPSVYDSISEAIFDGTYSSYYFILTTSLSLNQYLDEIEDFGYYVDSYYGEYNVYTSFDSYWDYGPSFSVCEGTSGTLQIWFYTWGAI